MLSIIVDFALFPEVCVFSHISQCVSCSCCMSGDSHAGTLIENPFPRYSVINKGKDFLRSKWPLVSDNRASLALPPLTTAVPRHKYYSCFNE